MALEGSLVISSLIDSQIVVYTQVAMLVLGAISNSILQSQMNADCRMLLLYRHMTIFFHWVRRLPIYGFRIGDRSKFCIFFRVILLLLTQYWLLRRN
ncbi:hypothetical protein BDP27DRAFT_1339524 [Rhodocollybia butyracea]|uniref:Uncharacterized protein n=1 Tax=Rhodocollybia butyracea TaxID=206335 RepID=A0A9P5TZM3_9AGAR|nr:hypothetical protein BDP27DRAFT_1339524 [Rhodocollybia butyracea]